MPASIESLVNGLNPVTGASRNDLRAGDLVTLNDVGGPGTSWSWALAYTPDDKDMNDSAAALAGNVLGPGPVTFTVDNEGSYLVRLIKDAALPTESVQYVRLRFLTVFGDLRLVAAGERRDGSGVIPVDISAEGWANDQNFNLITLNCFIKKVASSGRLLYVDANRGPNSGNAPNDPAIAEGYADYSSINAAITAALTDVNVNGNLPPSAMDPFVIAVRPGIYEEAVNFQPYVNVVGLPSADAVLGDDTNGDRSVILRTPTAGALTHTVTVPTASDYVLVKGILFENKKVTTNAVIRKTGEGTASFLDCRVVQMSNDPSDGACLAVDRGNFFGERLYLQNLNTEPTAEALQINPALANTATALFQDCRMVGSSVATLNNQLAPGVAVKFLRTSMVSTSISPLAHGVDTNAETTLICYSEGQLSNGQPDFLRVNPSSVGSPGDLFAGVYYSVFGPKMPGLSVRQGVLFDTTLVGGNAIFENGASEYSSLTLVGPNPLTQRATTNSRSLFYDNTVSGLVAENVQDAIDEIAGAVVAPSLDTAYDNGRIITVDADAVELHGPGVITDPPPLNPQNGDGTLRVYQQVEIGAILNPEILLASNNFGNGPSIEMGEQVQNDDSSFGSSAHLFANSSGTPDFYNYNLRLGAKDAAGNDLVGSTTMGNVVVRGGTALCGSGVNAPTGGSLFMIAGGIEENLGGNPGNVWLTPGATGAGLTGAVNIVNSLAATPATLTAGANFVDAAATPAGTLTFATSSGRVDVTFAGGENFASIQSLLSTGTGMAATWAGVGNPIVLTTSVSGPDAELILIEDSTAGALNTYLGDFSIVGGAVFVPGTYPEFVSMTASGTQELTIGNGTNDLVYNAITGKLTVPGLIDPTGMIFEEFDEASIPTGAGRGAIFVSDGSGGAGNTNSLYYKDASGTLTDLLAAGGGAPVGATYLTVNAEGGLPNSRRLLTTAGQLSEVDSGPGTNLTIGLADTAVTPGSYTRANLTVDQKGRLTASTSSSTQVPFTRQMLVPVGASPGLFPFTVNEFDVQVVNTGLTIDGTAAGGTFSIFLSQALGYGGANEAEIDLLVGPPGAEASILTAPIDISLEPANTYITLAPADFSVGLPFTIPVGNVVVFQVTYQNPPPAGDGLVLALNGEI